MKHNTLRYTKYLTVEEAAQYLQVSDKHIRRMIKKAGLPCVKVGPYHNSHLRIKPEALDEWLLANSAL